MTVCFFIHSVMKWAEAIALVDSGATENFMNLQYAKWLKLPIKKLPVPRKLFNVDGTENKTGELQWYTDLEIQTGSNHTTMRFFLSDLGEHKAILGYSWFAAVQPKIDWKQGWIDSSHLPIIFRADNTKRARFVPWIVNKPREIHKDKYFIGRAVINPNQPLKEDTLKNILKEYWQHVMCYAPRTCISWLMICVCVSMCHVTVISCLVMQVHCLWTDDWLYAMLTVRLLCLLPIEGTLTRLT